MNDRAQARANGKFDARWSYPPMDLRGMSAEYKRAYRIGYRDEMNRLNRTAARIASRGV